MSTNSPPSRGLSPDDALPPVEPPSAGFILQLFIVPGVIVVVVVIVWVMFNWLAQMGNDGDAFVRALSRNNEGRWQAAFNLANALRAEEHSSNPHLTIDPQLARQLAGILEREIDTGSMEENPLELRIYLCRALGAFRVPDPLQTLIRAATTERDEKEADVRRAAVEGIALLAANVPDGDKQFAANPELKSALVKASEESDPRTRSVAAVAMGVIGGDDFLSRLRAMTSDLNPDVRYNAAMRLAVRGDAAAVPVLVEMLDQGENAGVEIEKVEQMRPAKRVSITINALKAGEQLAEKSPAADLSDLARAVEKLLADKTTPNVRVEATNLLRQLNARAAVAR